MSLVVEEETPLAKLALRNSEVVYRLIHCRLENYVSLYGVSITCPTEPGRLYCQ